MFIMRYKRILFVGAFTVFSTVTYAQQFSETKCPFGIPSGERAQCGFLTVPESHGDKSEKTIKLFVTVVKSYSHHPKRDPIVYLVGKPSPAPSTMLSQGKYWGDFAALRQDRDMIFVDQRGSGLSEPNLNCKNLPNPKLISEQDYLIALKNCRDQFVKDGVNLPAFNTKESAQDIIDLMRELSYKTWNILATSFGTRVALAIMNIQPQHVRSVVLNSSTTLIPEQNDAQTIATNNERVFKKLFYDCGVSNVCRKAFPNLSDVYLQLVRTLPNSPEKGKVSAGYVVTVLSKEISNDNALHYLPETIFELAKVNAKGQLSEKKLKDILNKYHIKTPAAETSYYCYDAGKLFNDLKKNQKGTPFYSAKPDSICKVWGDGFALEVFQNSTYQSIPTMVLTGEYDTVMPSQWSRDVARQLPNAKLFQFKGVGNDVVRSLHCALFMSSAFFDRPDHKPEDACMMALKPPVFAAKKGTHKS